MQIKEIFRRAGLFLLFNPIYGIINTAKFIIVGSVGFGWELAESAWDHSILGKIFTLPAFAVGFALGALGGLYCGLRDFFINFEGTIRNGDYKTTYSFKDIFETNALEFKYDEAREVESESISPNATPKIMNIPHTISL